ncbi:LytR family transcriptional regulator [Nitriliruptoraceae bacterium ZYF776]|nr:LytR family transcriptional regulator [Profundirhabdus halotolerans]
MSEQGTTGGGPLGHLAFAVGLVVVVALGFWGLGNLRDTTPTVDDPPPTAGPEDDASDAEEPAGPTDGAEDGGEGDADADGDDEGTDGDDGDDGAPSGEIDPGSITIQVLDGTRGDGAAAGGVATELREAGYQVVAENTAIPYDVTTVFWTGDAEGAARQVAAEIGATEVAEQPGTLSDSVDVHVVVGADRVATGDETSEPDPDAAAG